MRIAIYFDQPGLMSYPFDNVQYYQSYQAFARLCDKRGIDLCIARTPESYQGEMTFQSTYRFEHDHLVFCSSPQHVDCIFMKGYHLTTGPLDTVVNHPELSAICHDKLRTYDHFSHLMPLTQEITVENSGHIFQNISTDMVIIKPITGTEGKGITVIKKSNWNPSLIAQGQRYFVQPFLDSSDGIPGVTNGMHDLRLIIINGAIIASYIREPKKGSLLANIAPGGTLRYIPVDQLPQTALELTKEIDRYFHHYSHRLYAVDLLYAKGKPYLIELNDQPGMPYLEEDRYDGAATLFYEKLLEVLQQAAEQKARETFSQKSQSHE